MGSIVLDLQQEIVSKECDIVNALRKAHLIAIKLGLVEFDEWIRNELNGYPNQQSCPDYRKIHCVLKGFNPRIGWIPTVITDPEIEKSVNETFVVQSVSELITLIDSNQNGLIINCGGAEISLFNKFFSKKSLSILMIEVNRSPLNSL